jgi:dCMP deaminase
MTERISRDQMLMEMAIIASKRSTCSRKHVGAIIAIEGRPVSVGYAGAPAGLPHCLDHGCLTGPDGGCIRTQHAEANAIAFAARKGIATERATLYTTVSPCLACAKLIINAGIEEVWFLELYRKMEGLELLGKLGIACEQLRFQMVL